MLGGLNRAEPIEARYLHIVGTLRTFFWLAAVAISLVIFYFGLVMGGIVPWLALPITISGVIATALSAWYLWRAWRERRIDAPVVTVSEQGFHDTRLGALIPWREIVALERYQPGTQVMLHIEARQAERFLKSRYKFPFGTKPAKPVPPGKPVTSHLSGLDINAEKIAAAAEAFHAGARA